MKTQPLPGHTEQAWGKPSTAPPVLPVQSGRGDIGGAADSRPGLHLSGRLVPWRAVQLCPRGAAPSPGSTELGADCGPLDLPFHEDMHWLPPGPCLVLEGCPGHFQGPCGLAGWLQVQAPAWHSADVNDASKGEKLLS